MLSNMGFFGDIWDALVEGIMGIWRMCVKVVKAVVNFFSDIFNWLKDLLEDDDDKDAFVVDWAAMVEEAKKQGRDFKELSLDEKNEIWENIKKLEK